MLLIAIVLVIARIKAKFSRHEKIFFWLIPKFSGSNAILSLVNKNLKLFKQLTVNDVLF